MNCSEMQQRELAKDNIYIKFIHSGLEPMQKHCTAKKSKLKEKACHK